MAPEVALQDPYDKSADVFSYGMVLYELMTRKKPPPRKMRDGYAFDLALKVRFHYCFLVRNNADFGNRQPSPMIRHLLCGTCSWIALLKMLQRDRVSLTL